MAVRGEALAWAPAEEEERERTAAGAWVAGVALAAVAGGLLAIRLDLPGYFDNEGRYADVAWEMVQRGDYVTPELNSTLFLNKPPLLFWLTALVFRWLGPTEVGRLASVGAAALAVLVTCRLGGLLYGVNAGLLAGGLLATSLGFVIEARTLRPEMLLLLTVTVALLCWYRAETSDARRTRWLAGMYAALGAGMLAKGFVPLVIVGLPVAILTWREHGVAGVARLRLGAGLALVAALALPWHALVALRHPGFAWDYIVNQHLLAFFDRKVPLDSQGDTLAFFWSAFVGRSLPWIALVPFVAGEARAGFARGAAGAARGTAFLAVWAAAVLLFFSAAPSRLEHYSVPAAPAIALLAARGWQRLAAGRCGTGAWRFLVVAAAAPIAAGAALAASGSTLLAGTYWIAQAPGLADFAGPAAAVLLAGGLAVLSTTLGRWPRALVMTTAVTFVSLAVIVVRAEIAAEPLFSWRPVAERLRARLPPDAEVVFEAPEEYQLAGGLAFYLQRPVTLLEVPGFVPPSYLVPHAGRMFLPRAELGRRWHAARPLAFVSDPLQRRDAPDGLVPQPFHVLARFGDRWVLTNFPVAR